MARFRLTSATLGLALLAVPAFAQTTTSPRTAGTTPAAPAAPPGTAAPATPPAGATLTAPPNNGPSGTLLKVQDKWRGSKLVGATVYNEGGDNVGGGEERGELGARNQLHVAQRRAFRFGLTGRQTRRLPAGKSGRNQALITIWSLVHPPAVSRTKSGLDKES